MKELGFAQRKMKYGSNNNLCVFELNDDIKIYVMPIFHSDDIENIVEVEFKANNDNDDEAERAEYERLKKKFENK